MTVAELIEALQRLPGDSDLRTVMVRMTLQRPYASDTRVEGYLTDVGISHDVANIDCYGYVE